MFKRILVPVDGSPTANRGLRTAIALALDQRCPLELLHVVDELMIAPLGEGGTYLSMEHVATFLAAMRQQGKRVLRRAEALADKAGVPHRAVLVEAAGGPVSDRIVAHAKRCSADLIVLGTHGRRGLARIVMGSDAEGVVRTSSVPVLLVRSRAAAASQANAAARRSTNA